MKNEYNVIEKYSEENFNLWHTRGLTLLNNGITKKCYLDGENSFDCPIGEPLADSDLHTVYYGYSVGDLCEKDQKNNKYKNVFNKKEDSGNVREKTYSERLIAYAKNTLGVNGKKKTRKMRKIK